MSGIIYIGIDPGMSGAVAWVGDNGVIQAEKFADKTQKDIFEIFRDRVIGNPMPGEKFFAVLEQVHSMPKQGVASSFKFGANYGLLQGFLYALGIPFVYVSPQKWQKFMGISTRGKKTKTEHKNNLKDFAQRLFPHLKITLAIADSLLLAEYSRQIYSLINMEKNV